MKRLVALLAVTALMLVGCVSIPSSGPITPAEVGDIEDRAGVEFIAQPPPQGGTPEAIILGFLLAGVSPADDYEVARQYLTEPASYAWDPSAEVRIRSAQPQISMTTETAGEVAVNLTSRVDGRGVMHRVEETTQILSFEVTMVEGEWRLSEVPQGLLLSSYMFEQLFTGVALQWYTTDNEFFVPDVRWMPNIPETLARNVIEGLIDGPATWLQSSVLPSAASGSVISGDIRDRPGGGVSVTLNTSRPGSVTEQDLSRFALQVQRSLVSIAGTVEVRVDGAEDVVGLSSEAEAPVTDSLWPKPYFYRDGEVHEAQANGPLITGLGERLSELGAESYTLIPGVANPRVGAAHARGDVYWINDEETVQIGEQTATDPTIDRFSTVWWVDNAEDQRVHAWQDGEVQEFTVELGGERVSAIAVSPEGARLAVVTTSGENTTIRLFSVLRAGGVPESLLLGPELPAPGGRLAEVVWSLQDALVVVADEGETSSIRQVRLDGTSELFNPISSPVSEIAPQAGGGGIVALTSDGKLFTLTRVSSRSIAVNDVEFLIS